jgi:hypothetical protein
MKQQCEGEFKMLHAGFAKNLHTEFKQRGEIQNSPYGMKQQQGGKFKMLRA